MGRMGVAAVGAYFKTLADVQPGTIADATGLAGVQAKYIWRLETMKIKEPSAKVLRLLTLALRGSWEDVGDLIADDAAGVSDGRTRAMVWALQAGLVKDASRATFEHATAAELDRAIEMLRKRSAALQEK